MCIQNLLGGLCLWATLRYVLQVLPQLIDGGQPEEEETADDAADEFDLQDIMAEEVTASVPSKEERLKQVRRIVNISSQQKQGMTKSNGRRDRAFVLL